VTANSFTVKRLKAVITLADDSNTVFDSSGNNTLTIETLRMTATTIIANRQASQLDLKIFGMLTKDMDALTSAWIDSESIRDNRVELYADDGNGYKLVFKGTIIEAQPLYKMAPDVPFQILGMISYFNTIEVTDPVSYQGSIDINVIGKSIADKMKLSFVSNAKATLNNPNYPGTIFDQLRNMCYDAKVDFYFQGDTLVFTPVEKPFSNTPTVVLSPSTGLIGYPMYTRRGLVATALYDAAYLCGSAIEIKDSAVKGTNGRWYPFSIQFDLSANTPRGPWMATLQCNKAGL
jgi:hypothetical protein